MLLILFGLAGSGKNYVGELLQQHTESYFWDADEVLTPIMQKCIETRAPFTPMMRDEYYAIVLENIKKLCLRHPHLVVAQSFYKNKHRQDVLSHCPEALFVQIKADPALLQQRLRTRSSLVDETYAMELSIHFEEPTHPYCVLENNQNSDEWLLSQIEQLSSSS